MPVKGRHPPHPSSTSKHRFTAKISVRSVRLSEYCVERSHDYTWWCWPSFFLPSSTLVFSQLILPPQTAKHQPTHSNRLFGLHIPQHIHHWCTAVHDHFKTSGTTRISIETGATPTLEVLCAPAVTFRDVTSQPHFHTRRVPHASAPRARTPRPSPLSSLHLRRHQQPPHRIRITQLTRFHHVAKRQQLRRGRLSDLCRAHCGPRPRPGPQQGMCTRGDDTNGQRVFLNRLFSFVVCLFVDDREETSSLTHTCSTPPTPSPPNTPKAATATVTSWSTTSCSRRWAAAPLAKCCLSETAAPIGSTPSRCWRRRRSSSSSRSSTPSTSATSWQPWTSPSLSRWLPPSRTTATSTWPSRCVVCVLANVCF